MTGFRKVRGRDRRALRIEGDAPHDVVVAARFAQVEVSLLRQLVSEVVLLLDAEASVTPGASEDDTGGGIEDQVNAIFAGLQPDGTGAPQRVAAPDDEVVARLLPSAYPDDADAAADFRRYTQDRLVASKRSAATTLLASLPEVADPTDAVGEVDVLLDRDGAAQWLRALTDVRLALGTRLGVEQDDDERWAMIPDDDPRTAVHGIYQWLGWVQETLVAAMPRRR